MRAGTVGRFAYGIIFTLMLPIGPQIANARPFAHSNVRSFAYNHHRGGHFWHRFARSHWHRYGGLQCVAFARQETGMQLRGNAAVWWNEAAGEYARGHVPEPGSILSFRGAGRMRLGHVAVVRNVVNSREIDIDHAHWAGGGIYRDVSVIDVSPNNDWTAVRVALRRGAEYGSVYATNGFIYDRAPNAPVQIASATTAGPAPEAHVQTASAVSDSTSSQAGADAATGEDAPVAEEIHPHHRRHWHRWVARRRMYAEVAEAPLHHRVRR